MRLRNLAVFPSLALFAVVSGCSGGSTEETPPGAASCGSAEILCVTSCNLGCTSNGDCTITDISPNQPLIFNFSQNIDPASVDGASFSLKTPSGEEPVGDVFVEGGQITFIPEVRSLQGATFFGFTANASYVLTLPGGPSAPAAITSTAGDRLDRTLTCTFRVTRPVVDLDQLAPAAELVTPATLSNVPRDTTIVLEFSEFIDFGPFFNATPEEQPIQYRVRRTVEPDPINRPGDLRCDPASRTVQLNGNPRLTNDPLTGRTRVSFSPIERLPPGACVEVSVTTRVRDLAGTRAESRIFRFTLVASDAEDQAVEFEFDNDLALDRDRSSSLWENGEARFLTLGGDGRHGDFSITDGQPMGPGRFLFDTDNTSITQKPTGFLNEATTVTDGRYYFSRFVVPAGTVLEFRGSKPARVFVRGECRIDGEVVLDGERVRRTHDGINTTAGNPGPGQSGSLGGAGGGRGGDGAFGCLGDGQPQVYPQFNFFNGFDGEDLVLPADGGYVHPLAGLEAGTGGKGAPLFPTHGNQAEGILRWGIFGGTYAIEAAGGGGGAGFRDAGTAGETLQAGSGQVEPPNRDPTMIGDSGAGGVSVPLVASAATPTSLYYLIGGAGGGGGASHPLFAQRNINIDPFRYRSGAAGAGGGGALLLRAGNRIRVGENGRIGAAGGSCDPTATSTTILSEGALSPGGGGSGGSIVLQSSSGLEQAGTLDVSGGQGARTSLLQQFFNAVMHGGDGSPGFLRVETAGTAPAITDLGTTLPAAGAENVGVLDEAGDGDDLVGFQTVFVGTNEAFAPLYLRYEIVAEFRGPGGTRTQLYSDDPNAGPSVLPAGDGQALRFYIQGIDVDASSGEPISGATPGPWRRLVGNFGLPNGEPGLNSDATTGFRWTLVRDRSVEPESEVVVQSVRIFYRS